MGNGPRTFCHSLRNDRAFFSHADFVVPTSINGERGGSGFVETGAAANDAKAREHEIAMVNARRTFIALHIIRAETTRSNEISSLLSVRALSGPRCFQWNRRRNAAMSTTCRRNILTGGRTTRAPNSTKDDEGVLVTDPDRSSIRCCLQSSASTDIVSATRFRSASP